MNVAETDYYNNIAVCNIIYEPSRLHAYNCHIPDDYEHNFIAQFYTPRAYAGKFNFAKLNRYRRGLETCPQAKTSESGHTIFFSFFRCVRATSMTPVHFWTFSPVSVKHIKILFTFRKRKSS